MLGFMNSDFITNVMECHPHDWYPPLIHFEFGHFQHRAMCVKNGLNILLISSIIMSLFYTLKFFATMELSFDCVFFIQLILHGKEIKLPTLSSLVPSEVNHSTPVNLVVTPAKPLFITVFSLASWPLLLLAEYVITGLGPSSFLFTTLCSCNVGSLTAGFPDCNIAKLQSVQNAAAKLILQTPKFDHVTPVLTELHWLPVHQHILFKILELVYKALDRLSQAYISSFQTSYKLARALCYTSKFALTIPKYITISYGADFLYFCPNHLQYPPTASY